jgi:excisionase family DNA binding protein
MVSQDPSELERRLDAGEWLSPGQVASLLGTSRSTVTRRINDGTLRYRRRAAGIQRVCNPEDVRRLLDAAREVRGGDGQAPSAT